MGGAMLDRLAECERRLQAVEEQLRELLDARVPSWSEIGRELLVDERTARRWAERNRDPLPVETSPGGDRWAWRSALVAWARRNHVPHQAAQRIEELEQQVRSLARELAAIRQSATALPETARDPTTGVLRRRPAKCPDVSGDITNGPDR